MSYYWLAGSGMCCSRQACSKANADCLYSTALRQSSHLSHPLMVLVADLEGQCCCSASGAHQCGP